MRPSVIIIPGLGDFVWLCKIFLPIWRLIGFEPIIYRFGWNDRVTLIDKLEKLSARIDKIHGAVYVIGMSAGGTAAVNMLTMNSKVQKVVTVSSPYQSMDQHTTPLLTQSIARLIVERNARIDRNILSLYGLYDDMVPVPKSQPKGIRTKRVLGVGHWLSIFVAMTFYARYIKKFFK